MKYPDSEQSLGQNRELGEIKRTWYPEKPIVIDVVDAHKSTYDGEPYVTYQNDGSVIFNHPHLVSALEYGSVEIPSHAVFDTLFPSFESLNSALSAVSNSPRLEGDESLRESFDREFSQFTYLASQTIENNDAYVPYGSYVFDPVNLSLTQILPEKWMKIGLLTSNSKLLTDPENNMSWQEIQKQLQNKIVGFAGVSVGGSVLESWLRNARPHETKLADPDTPSIQNFNRAERMNISHLTLPRSARHDWRNPFDTQIWNKARYMAYEQQKVDPYQNFCIYDEGITESNVHDFLNGNREEAGIDLLVEEVDDPRWKYQLRRLAKENGIPVLMMSDFGHRVQLQFQDYKHNPEMPIGYQVSDDELEQLYIKMINSGNIEDRWNFIDAFCGNEYRTDEEDEFAQWVSNKGEQPTASLPQLGSAAMVSGGLGGEVIARYFLGHQIPERQIWDLKKGTIV